MAGLSEWGIWSTGNASVLSMAGGIHCMCSGRTREGMGEKKGGGGDGVVKVITIAKSGETDWNVGGLDKALVVEKVGICCAVATCALRSRSTVA